MWMGFLLIGCVVALSFSPQIPANSTAPQLRLTILASKSQYIPNEKVFVDVAIDNLSDKTLCFPQPDKKCRDTRNGSLIVEGNGPPRDERELFICRYCGGSWGPHDKLVSAIREKWMKIVPGSTFLSKSVEAQVILDVPGDWHLKASYRPPVSAFGDPAEFRRYLEAGAKEAGCVVPSQTVSAEAIAISVVAKQSE